MGINANPPIVILSRTHLLCSLVLTVILLLRNPFSILFSNSFEHCRGFSVVFHFVALQIPIKVIFVERAILLYEHNIHVT